MKSDGKAFSEKRLFVNNYFKKIIKVVKSEYKNRLENESYFPVAISAVRLGIENLVSKKQ
jgi:hypothetical protein